MSGMQRIIHDDLLDAMRNSCFAKNHRYHPETNHKNIFVITRHLDFIRKNLKANIFSRHKIRILFLYTLCVLGALVRRLS